MGRGGAGSAPQHAGGAGAPPFTRDPVPQHRDASRSGPKHPSGTVTPQKHPLTPRRARSERSRRSAEPPRALPRRGAGLTYPGPRGSVPAALGQMRRQQQQRQQQRASPGAAPCRGQQQQRRHRPLGSAERRRRQQQRRRDGLGRQAGGCARPSAAGSPPRPWGCPL